MFSKKPVTIFSFLLLAFIVAMLTIVPVAWSDDDDHDDDHHDEKYEKSERKKGGSRWFVFRRVDVTPVKDTVYLKECGACHFAYQPGLLPSKSWELVMSGLGDHFGDVATLDEITQSNLTKYLVDNAAENGEGKESYKILRSLKGETPLRITDVPRIRREHRERSLERKGLKSFANCDACHKDASEGMYDDD